MWLLHVILPLISLLPIKTMICPRCCMCNQEGAVKCVGSITDVPKMMPNNTYLLQLNNTNITFLREQSLADLPLMLRLSISFSFLNTIHPNAFKVSPQLLSVKLSFNNLTTLPPRVFSPLISLEQLHLDGNRLESIAPVLFEGLSRLTELEVSRNAIVSLAPNVFSSLSNLRFLNLGKNSIRELPPTIFHSLTRLQFLMLYNNQLERIEAGTFDKLTYLMELKLHHNRIANLAPEVFWALGNLMVLTLSSNRLQGIPEKTFYHMPKLTKLTLYSNPLLSLPDQLMGHMPLINDLYLYGTNLTIVPWNLFANMSGLQKLFFHLNEKLRGLPPDLFCCQPRLQRLSLKANALEVLDCNLFSKLTHLQVLLLNDNKLHSLPKDIFKGLSNLTSIEMKNNHLKTLSSEAFSFNGGLKDVTLGGNPWDCSCSIRDIVSWIRRKERVVSDRENVKCYSPQYRVLRTLRSLHNEEFSMCDTTTPSSYVPTTPYMDIDVSSTYILYMTVTSTITPTATTAPPTTPDKVLLNEIKVDDSFLPSFPPYYELMVFQQGPEFVHSNRRKGWLYVWSLSSDRASAGFFMALHILLVAVGVALSLASIYGMYCLQQSMDDFTAVTIRKPFIGPEDEEQCKLL